MKAIIISIRATVVTLILTGVLYPLAMAGAAQALFSDAANGTLVKDKTGQVRGSALIGQVFTNPAYFQGRPSAAGNGYDATSSGGSNLGTTSAKLRDRAKADAERLRKENPDAPGLIPAELVTASASGLDPHISPATAMWQVKRVARARGVAEERVGRVVEDLTEGRQLGFLGEPRVNLLALNMTIDRNFGGAPRPPAAAVPATK
ncbi:MAG TPA: potassium-transporting ATPase subunit KdpC [Polyangia bacterium]|jgi:K+-transporting ATPase ATPase C chain|nr:potassium-transporting ATPase subunit KdpC [Polyangia bacterium]